MEKDIQQVQGENVVKNIEKPKNVFNNPLKWDILKWVIAGLVSFVVLIFVFGAGVMVGAKKAEFSYRWAENYHNNFAGPRMGFMNNLKEFPAGDFIESHGSVGKIIEIDNNNIIIQGRENTEKTIIVEPSTIFKGAGGDIKISDLKVDDLITIIGSPNDAGQIEAKLIRVMPAPPMSFLPESINHNKNINN